MWIKLLNTYLIIKDSFKKNKMAKTLKHLQIITFFLSEVPEFLVEFSSAFNFRLREIFLWVLLLVVEVIEKAAASHTHQNKKDWKH